MNNEIIMNFFIIIRIPQHTVNIFPHNSYNSALLYWLHKITPYGFITIYSILLPWYKTFFMIQILALSNILKL